MKILGRKRRPWMLLQRSELELTYLRHQQRQLRQAYSGELESEIQQIPTNSFYDDYRLAVHCPQMRHVYDLLYPRDEKRITKELLLIAGPGALPTLWCDRGRHDGKRITFGNFRDRAPTTATALWLEDLGYGATEETIQRDGRSIRLSEGASRRFAEAIYQKVHPTLRKELRALRR